MVTLTAMSTATNNAPHTTSAGTSSHAFGAVHAIGRPASPHAAVASPAVRSPPVRAVSRGIQGCGQQPGDGGGEQDQSERAVVQSERGLQLGQPYQGCGEHQSGIGEEGDEYPDPDPDVARTRLGSVGHAGGDGARVLVAHAAQAAGWAGMEGPFPWCAGTSAVTPERRAAALRCCGLRRCRMNTVVVPRPVLSGPSWRSPGTASMIPVPVRRRSAPRRGARVQR